MVTPYVVLFVPKSLGLSFKRMILIGTIGHARLRSGVFVRIALDPPRWRRLYPEFSSRFCNFVGLERVVSL
jgi:hypothetical protein